MFGISRPLHREILNMSKIVTFTFRTDALEALQFLKSIIDAGKLFQTFATRWLNNRLQVSVTQYSCSSLNL